MIALFLHPNFPGQFRRLATALAQDARWQVFSLGDRTWMNGNDPVPAVSGISYDPLPPAPVGAHPWSVGFDAAIRRGQQAIGALTSYKERGLEPDVIITHPGWGDAFFVRDFFPGARVIGLFEYFYRPRGADVGFDPEFPGKLNDIFRLHASNATQLLALESCDERICPTAWQKSRFPSAYTPHLSVIHEGIDSAVARPDPNASFTLANGLRLCAGAEVLTYVSRSLEPYRGFHVFMRALPTILRQRPQCQALIVGAEGASYGPKTDPSGQSWKQKYLQEVAAELDQSRVHFTGTLPYADYLRVLQISRLHVYLTYPFILSWSVLEAMACGCVVLASDTAPVHDAIEDEVNGLLFAFRRPDLLAELAVAVLADPQAYQHLGRAARQTIVERYDFASVSLPAYQALLPT